ncbi:MAG: protein kinase [Chloroflexi bacterium]|nr:protein kinase [Chloroflexota bacterium]
MDKMVAERYQLGKLLGMGAVGRVYEAIDMATNTPVAVKVLTKKEFAESQSIIERFVIESEALRKLRHPNIVHLVEYLQFVDEHYIVMELVSGGSLSEYIYRHKPLPIERVLDIALELADALTRAHHLNIIHRDIKPGNVLLADDGTPRLTDFGVARIGDSDITQQGQIVGTLPYLSPESFLNKTIDVRSDVWSFGVLMYEMLTGERPFNLEIPAAIITAILTQPIPRIENKRDDSPVALIDLIYRILERNPDARIPSMRLVGAELENIRYQLDTKAPSPTYRTIFKKPVEPVGELQTYVPITNNLPAESTPFFGRSASLERLVEWLADPSQRLLTIVGLGGVGKTRLALAVAHDAQMRFPDGIFFVGLAAVQNTDQIIPAIAEALKLQFSGKDDPLVELLDYLRAKRCLLILDTLEHLPGATEIIAEILSFAPQLKILATSRRRLRLKSETVIELTGLDVPDEILPLEKMRNYAAVKLFIDSARRVKGDFKLTDENAPQVASIIRMVDGLPLGIELAAAWLEVLPVEEVRVEVQKSLDFLKTDLCDVPDRHRSMRAIFDYSWNLMTVHERDIFLKLSVFQSGFERQAAASVTGASLQTLSTLVNKSLIRRNPEGRYIPQELLREYATELFDVFSDDLYQTHHQHARYFADVLISSAMHFDTDNERRGIETIDRDLDNIRAAWKWAMQHEQWDMLGEMLHPLATYFHSRSMLRDGHNTLQTLADLLQGNDSQKTLYWRASLRSVWLLIRVGEYSSSYRQARECLDYFKKTPLTVEVILALNCMAYARMMQGQTRDAIKLSATALEKARQIDDPSSLYISISTLGYAKYLAGDYAGAASLYDQLLYLHEEERFSTLNLAFSLNSYGEIIMAQGRHADASLLFEKALEIFRTYRHRRGMASSLNNLAGINLALGETSRARDQYEKSLRLNEKIGNRYGAAHSLSALGLLAFRERDYDRAIEYYERALDLRRALGHYQGVAASLLDLGLVYMARSDYHSAYSSCQQSTTMHRKIDDRAGLIQTLIWSAFAALQNREFKLAREHINEAEAITEANPEFRETINIIRADLELGLGDMTAALEATQAILRTERPEGAAETLYALAILAHIFYLNGDSERAATNAQSILDVGRPVFSIGRMKARQVLELVEKQTPRRSVSIESLLAEVD